MNEEFDSFLSTLFHFPQKSLGHKRDKQINYVSVLNRLWTEESTKQLNIIEKILIKTIFK